MKSKKFVPNFKAIDHVLESARQDAADLEYRLGDVGFYLPRRGTEFGDKAEKEEARYQIEDLRDDAEELRRLLDLVLKDIRRVPVAPVTKKRSKRS